MRLHLSGIQPSGRFHLGNYLGCIKPFLKIQSIHPPDKKNIFLVADLHCFTKPENCTDLSSDTIEAVKSLLALGVDPKHVDIVQQSSILEHTQLAWLLSCLTKFSRAENMTQFKTNREKYPNVGIFTYPILQAADILLYRPTYVLVGPDQRQHLELVAELCERLHQVCGSKVITKPEALISNLRVMSLSDESKKMSKSDPSSCVFLSDPPEIIHKKVLKAKTDSVAGITYDKANRNSLANLIDIYSSLSEQSVDEFASSKSHLGHRQFKDEMYSFIANYFKEFRYNYQNISLEECKRVLNESRGNVQIPATKTLKEIMNKAGFI